MQLRTICIGRPKKLTYLQSELLTSIYKDPISRGVFVATKNIEGDEQADLSVHGGLDKAVYGFSADAYSWWNKNYPLGNLLDGAFGENLTIENLDDESINIGDTFKIGTCVLQVTQPRIPCIKLAAKFNDPKILKKFFESRKPGPYFRVLTEGFIQAGDKVEFLHGEQIRVSLLEIFDISQGMKLEPERAHQILSLQSLPDSLRQKILKKLKQINSI